MLVDVWAEAMLAKVPSTASMSRDFFIDLSLFENVVGYPHKPDEFTVNVRRHKLEGLGDCRTATRPKREKLGLNVVFLSRFQNETDRKPMVFVSRFQ
jgi:hypothetical protein